MSRPREFEGMLPDWMLDHDDWPAVHTQTIEEVTCECCPNRTTARDGLCRPCRVVALAEDQASRDLTS